MEMRPFNFESCKERFGDPIMFMIKTHIDKKFMGEVTAKIINHLKQYQMSASRWKVFYGDPRYRITPKGQRTGNLSSYVKTNSPRFITVSKEIRAMFPSILSLIYTEITMSIIYLVYRKNEIEFLTRIMDDVSSAMKNPKMEEKTKLIIMKKWIDRLKLYINRHPNYTISKTINQYIPTLNNIVDSMNYKMFNRFFERVQNLVMEEYRNTASEKLVIPSVGSTILLKQKDFSYPLGFSFLEHIYNISLSKDGYEVYERDCLKNNLTTYLNNFQSIRDELENKIKRDIMKESLIPQLLKIDAIRNKFQIQMSFINNLAKIVSNFVFYMAKKYFYYGVGATDHKSGTTINWRVFNIILLGKDFHDFGPMNQLALEFFREVVVSFLQKD